MKGYSKEGLIAAGLLSAAAFALGDLWAAALRSMEGPWLQNVGAAMEAVPSVLATQGISAEPNALLGGFICFLAVWLAWAYLVRSQGNRRIGEEHGSARWGTKAEGLRFADTEDPFNNVILTENYGLAVDPGKRRGKRLEERPRNVLVIGGTGAGKTWRYSIPNILQMNADYFVIDSKGTQLPLLGNALVGSGYEISCMNLVRMSASAGVNPFSLIRDEVGIIEFAECFIANTTGDKDHMGDQFWVQAERLLYTALIGYIHYEAPMEEQNFSTLIEFINAMEVREDDEDFKNPVDLMFDELKKRKPDHFAVRQYAKFKLSAGKTAKSILISCGARLAPFDIQELRELTAYDELQLDTLGDRKTALFIIMSDTDDTFNFLISMCYTQLFNLLCEKADDVYGGRLPVHVRCLIDEAANIGQIPRLEKLVATIRSREISCCLVLQAQSQLKALYKDSADTIIGNMDCSIFLGGKEPGTLKELAAALGKETIDSYNTGESRGREVSHSLNYQKLGKELMSVDELAVLDGGKCILQLRGVRPFLSNKYDLTKHPLYRYTADYDKKYAFDIERFLSHRLKLKPDDAVEVYQADLSGEPVA